MVAHNHTAGEKAEDEERTASTNRIMILSTRLETPQPHEAQAEGIGPGPLHSPDLNIIE